MQLEGGFGHTITTPYILDYYYKNWILIFGYNSKRHNLNIKNIFNNKIYFFNINQINSNSKFLHLLFNFFFKIFLKKKILLFEKFYKKLPYNKFNEKDKLYLEKLESRQFYIFFKNKKKYKINFLKSKYLDFFKKLNFKRKVKINFYLRIKDKKNDLQSRNTENIHFYKNLILKMFSKGYFVIFTGDYFEIPNWLSKYKSYFLHPDLINSDYKEYLANVPFFSDLTIGVSSGGILYNLLSKKPILLLGCSHFGFSVPNAVLSYKKIKVKSKKELSEILKQYYENYGNEKKIKFYLKKYKFKKLTKKEVDQIVFDYLSNYKIKKYGTSYKSLQIKSGILRDTQARISPVWLKMINFKKLKKK